MKEIKIDYRNAFFDEFYKIASKDKNVIFLTADSDADSLVKFRENFPNQFHNTGVTEQNSVSMAAGLALSGKKVFIYSMVPFITLRCFEQIKIDICSLNLPICLIGLGTGLSFSYYGPAGHGVIDIAVMRTLSEMTILNPSDPISAANCANIAYKNKGPTYVRLHKSASFPIYNKKEKLLNNLELLSSGKDLCLISTGLLTSTAIEVIKYFKKNLVDIAHYDFIKISPINEKKFISTINKYKKIITLEDNIFTGGIGSILSEIVVDNELKIKIKRIAIKNEQCFDYGEVEWLYEKYHLDYKSVINTVKKFINT